VSWISDVATVHVLMADYASIDQSGKLNVIGGGISIVAAPTGAALTSSFYLMVFISVPADARSQKFVVGVSLTDGSGAIVTAPGEAKHPLVDVSQPVEFARPEIPAHYLFPDVGRLNELLKGRLQLVTGFPVGLPLASGRGYEWRIALDGVTRDEWVHRFVVAEQGGSRLPSSA